MSHSGSFLPFGSVADSDAEGPPMNDLPPGLRQAGRAVYRHGWEQYRRADCPFGPEDEAMLVWFSFNQGDTGAPLTVSRN